MPEITLFIAFSAGLLSFFSPCLLPVLPGFLAYVTGTTGITGQDANTGHRRALSLTHACFFVVGFSLIYIALGWSAGAVGSLFFKYDVLIRRIGALFIGTMGLTMLGVFEIGFLNRTVRWMPKNRSLGPFASFFIGLTFALGWSPCIGPIMGSILFLASTQAKTGMILMVFYSLGFAIPFLIAAYAFPSWRKVNRYTPILQRSGGVLLLITAVLLWMDALRSLANFLVTATGYVGV